MIASSLRMASDVPKLQKIEAVKLRSNYLYDPLKAEMSNDEVYLSPDAVIVLKYHGSYQQDDRDKRQKGVEKDYKFMLRLKCPAGEIPPSLYECLDDIAGKYGQGDLRITTRQAWQIHGVLKGNLSTVITSIMREGSSTVGACGDVNRNVMCTPAPFTTPEYQYARQYAKVLAELFKPQSPAVSELWVGEEKVVDMEYWNKDLLNAGVDIRDELLRSENDTVNGVLTSDPVEPLYGARYLPKKFKIALTVPGDNSVDIYTNDIGLVVIVDAQGELEGFNVMVGGGMGRTHNKESTFARAADHLGFVRKGDIILLCKCILAAQRDHGNREIRANARMKYLVHNSGTEGFRTLVEGYFKKPIQPWREIVKWRYVDWMGWHQQGDGKWFLGVNIQQGRVRDYADTATDPVTGSNLASLRGVRVRSALRQVVRELALTMVLSPTQSVIFRDIAPAQRARVEEILLSHGILGIDQVDALLRFSMACPALPLCGLAITEAERRMPEWVHNTRQLLNKLGMGEVTAETRHIGSVEPPHSAQSGGDSGHTITMRMTGCPNGCARPYMAELALVGDGPDTYQIWLGGSPELTQVAQIYKNKVRWGEVDREVEPLLAHWSQHGAAGEAFGTHCSRVGVAALMQFSDSYW
jgi:sulfite reductase (ferredoxin)